jgi:hypothetical protein
MQPPHKASECKKNKKEDEENAERDTTNMQQQFSWMA